MFRILLIFITFIIHYLIESVIIEYPSNKYIEERIRKDLDSIEPIFRHYIIPHEIQFHTDAIKDNLPYFLRCKGSKNSINFTIPISATKHLSLNTNHKTHTITATLRKNQLTTDLVGRYTCSELINDKKHEKTVHVFIQNENSVFTKKLYPKVFKQTGIHFLNLPCQSTNWYSRISCSIPSDSIKCKFRRCNLKENQINELKCNTPLCTGQELCIPVYYTPSNLKAEKIFFDPQIGFALENPIISNTLTHFTCMSNYTPNHQSKIPFDSSDPDDIRIHQPSFTVMSDETIRLSCEIQYEIKVNRKIPILFWFEDIYYLNLISNQTEKPVFNTQTQLYNRNTSITLRGFKPNKIYRFYCTRVSEQGLYTRSIDITCAEAPSLDLEINPSESNIDNKITYGSNGVYDISILTIPRSSIVIEISRNDISLSNDKRFELLSINNQENQFYEYTLTIYNITFEDEIDLKMTVKSSALEKTVIITPNIIGDPVGQLSFVPEQIPRVIPWRNENFKNKLNIYPYGIFQHESYRIVCTIHHHSDIKRSLNIFIQYFQCSIDNCLSNLINKKCQKSSNQHLIRTTSNRINNFQTQFISINSHTLDNPSIGYQYLCCYEQNGLINIAKGITILSHNHNMFDIKKPEFSLVMGDILTYRCEGHELIYEDLLMIYDDRLFTYERNSFDNEWRIKGTNQVKQIDIDWDLSINKPIRSIAIEIKTSPLKMIGNNGYIQCIGLSKQSDFIPNINDTYIINVDDPIPLKFKNNLQIVSKLERKAGDNIEFDCKYNGRPKPKLVWFKGKLPLNNDDSTLKFGNNNESVSITRAQALDTGYYTCELNNGRDPLLRRSFDLRVKGSNPYTRFGQLTAIIVIISILLLLLMLILLIIFAIKYYRMTQKIKRGIIHPTRPSVPEDTSQPLISQLTRIPLPANFASPDQIRTFLSYVNGDTRPDAPDDFKVLGRGQFGVVYQVRLPEIDLVAAKTLPETIRNIERRRDKRKKSNDFDESQEMITQHENQMQKAADMLRDEMKIMHRAGKHVSIVALKKVAYPEAKFKFLFTGGPIQAKDSFYLMEFCSNGSLESMLKSFSQSSLNTSHKKLSLYETLSETKAEMTIAQAYEQCILTEDDLRLIAYQVAYGIDYLNRKQIIHCDIAPRNVLVTSRFIMKICDFGLATWTTYKNYREQLEQHESVQLEKKTNEIAIHNLTPELARNFLRESTSNERSLLNKLSIKSDVWSFGIFLWTLFLKCQIRPFNKLLEEMENKSDGKSFFHRLARVISEDRVLLYIDYQPEIPRNIYAIIRECLVEESYRPEMIQIRARLCHSKMLRKDAFEYYRSEYNRYQGDNATHGNPELFGDVQGTDDLPSYDGGNSTDDNKTLLNPSRYDNVTSRPTTSDDIDYSQQETALYLTPINNNQQTDADTNNLAKTTIESNVPQVHIKNWTPLRLVSPPSSSKKPNEQDDNYL